LKKESLRLENGHGEWDIGASFANKDLAKTAVGRQRNKKRAEKKEGFESLPVLVSFDFYSNCLQLGTACLFYLFSLTQQGSNSFY